MSVEDRINLFKLSRDDKIKHILIRVEEKERENPNNLLIENIQLFIRRQFPTLSNPIVKQWSKITMAHVLDMREGKG